ncbi:MAG: hypothetical protein ACHP84_02760 [Caulobacterales bacterium]
MAENLKASRGLLDRATAVQYRPDQLRGISVDRLIEEYFAAGLPFEIAEILEVTYSSKTADLYWRDQLGPPGVSRWLRETHRFASTLAHHLKPRDVTELRLTSEKICAVLQSADLYEPQAWLRDPYPSGDVIETRGAVEWLLMSAHQELIPSSLRSYMSVCGAPSAGQQPVRRPSDDEIIEFLNSGRDGLRPTSEEIKGWAHDQKLPKVSTLKRARELARDDPRVNVQTRTAGQRLSDSPR